MGAGLATLICLVPALGFGVLIGTVIFRAAVRIANKVVGWRNSDPTRTQSDYPGDSIETDGGSFDESNPFAAPLTRTIAVDPSVGYGIPQPTFGRACLIVFVHGLVWFGIGTVAGLLEGVAGIGEDEIQLVSLVLGIAVAIFVYQVMLPTTIDRAALVWLFQLLIIIAIVFVILVVFIATRLSM